MDAIFRKWQNRYHISEEAYHALWGIISVIGHSSEVQLQVPLAHTEARQSQRPDISGPFPEQWLFQEVVQREKAVISNIEESFIFQPNIDESFIVGTSEVEQFDASPFVNGNTFSAASTYDVQPFPDDLNFLPRDTSIAAVQLPTGHPYGENLPDETLSDGTQSTGYQYCSPLQNSEPIALPQKVKRSFTNEVTEDSTVNRNKRRKSTKQCVRWKVTAYSTKLKWEHLYWKPSVRRATLRHEENGPTIKVDSYGFNGSSSDETRLYWKDKDDWKYLETTKFGLQMHEVDLTQYISQYTSFYLLRRTAHPSYVGQILDKVHSYLESELIAQAIGLWTANRLLMKGWELTGRETLGMAVVEQEGCPLHHTTPAPRVMQNQLDRSLESFIMEAEEKILRDLQKAMLKRSACSWEIICLAVIVILHVLENDSWRLLYWKYHRQERYNWRHPTSPETLIERNLHFSNMLVTYTRCGGHFPETLKLGLEKIKEPNYQYNEKDENSINGSLTHLMLKKSFNELVSAEDFVPNKDSRCGQPDAESEW